jgi:hypothetical protein
MLGLLDSFSVSLARPDPDLLAADKPGVANPHDGLVAERRAPRALPVVDHAPAPAGLGEDGVGVAKLVAITTFRENRYGRWSVMVTVRGGPCKGNAPAVTVLELLRLESAVRGTMMRISAAIRYACRATLVLALALGSAAAVAVSTAEPAGAAPAGSYQFCNALNPPTDPLCVPLQITPSSGLIDGQSVQVLSTGNVLPSTTYQLEECQGVSGQQVYTEAECDPTTLVTATTPATTNADGSGTLSTPFTVHLNITVNGAAVSCQFTACVIAVLGVPQYNPINFNGGGGGPPPFTFTSGGNFVIGDQNASVGNAVTFWGAQWAKNNSLSGGSGPNSFKGFANTPATAPTCGATWSSDPGNSSGAPSTVPGYTAVIVSSNITKSGSTISGNIVEIVIVKTNPGYGPDPGHAGTGTVVGVLCASPAVVTGTVTPTNTFPSGTTYGVAACPGSSGVVPGCTGLILAVLAEPSNPGGSYYSLALPPGTWSILGFANGTPATPFLIGADQPYVVETVTAGESLTLNWTVTDPNGYVTGTVTPTTAFPSGTIYGVIACLGSSPPGGCSGQVITVVPPGGYSLALPPGTYAIVGFAITPSGLVVADQSPAYETVTAGEVFTLNWTVTYTG